MPKTDEKLQKLCKGVRAIGHGAEIHIKPSEVLSDQWSVLVSVGAAFIIHSDFGTLDEALDQALSKLAGISSRMMAAIRQSPPTSEPPGKLSPPEGAPPSTPLPATSKKK